MVASLAYSSPYQQWNTGSMTNLGYYSNQTVYDKVPVEIIHLVDPYWKQFPPMNPLWHSLLAFFMAIVTIVALSGNAVVMYIFLSTKGLRSPSNLFVVNLAFSDFMIMFTMGPAMIWNCIQETWVLGELACTLYGMAGSLFGCASIWSMTMIAFDRYNVIVKGLSAKPLTFTGAILRILFIWVSVTVWTILPLFGWNRYVPEGNMTACGTDYITKDWISRSYILVYGAWVYFLPLLMIIYSYYFIMKAVYAHERNMREQAKKMNVTSLRSLRTGDSKQQSVEAKLAKVALMTISLWFVAWTPYLIINFAGIFEATRISPLMTIWGSVFAKCNAIYNPIVYGISHPRYRVALYKKFPALACTAHVDEIASTSSVITALPLEDKTQSPTPAE